MSFRLTTASFVTAASEHGMSQLWCSPVHSASSRQNEREWCLLIKTQLFIPKNTSKGLVRRHQCFWSNSPLQCVLWPKYLPKCTTSIPLYSSHPFLLFALCALFSVGWKHRLSTKGLTEGCSPLTFCRALFCGAVGVFTSGTELQAPPDPAGDLLPGVPAVLHRHISTVKCNAHDSSSVPLLTILKPSGHYMYHTVVTIRTTRINIH